MRKYLYYWDTPIHAVDFTVDLSGDEEEDNYEQTGATMTRNTSPMAAGTAVRNALVRHTFTWTLGERNLYCT